MGPAPAPAPLPCRRIIPTPRPGPRPRPVSPVRRRPVVPGARVMGRFVFFNAINGIHFSGTGAVRLPIMSRGTVTST